MNKTDIFINLALFQCLWFAAILGAAQGSNLYSIVGLCIFAVIHHFSSNTARTDFKLAALAILLGLFVETVFLQSGMLIYRGVGPSGQLAPIWILVLWANFALTINGCLNWLHGRYALAALLGAIGAPASYLGGIKLGAADAGVPLGSLLAAVAVIYAVVTPGLLFIANYLNTADEKR